MRKTTLIFCTLIAAAAFAPRALPQDAAPKPAETARAAEPPAHYYHLEFVVQELGADGKATNSRTYTTTVSTDSHETQSSIRTNSRIPIVSGSVSSGEDNKLVNTQFQYVDVGVNIDARHAHEIGRQLSLDLTANVSSVASASDSALHQPIIRENKWQAIVLIAVGKPSVVFTSDALDNKGSMQLTVTATPLQ